MNSFELDKNRRRVSVCPCGKSNRDGKFVPFVGYESKGYCHSCGKTYFPELVTDDLLDEFPVVPPPKPPSFIEFETFKKSLLEHLTIDRVAEHNFFVRFLITKFGEKKAAELVSSYKIGTSKYWNGSCVFWQVDKRGNIRGGKIMLYDPDNGKRIKSPYNHIQWVHKVLDLPEFNLKQCLFGEHLIANSSNRIALVESEKTAVIASAYMPEYTWVAVGGANNLGLEICQPLIGRDVTLFPDLNKFDDWCNKAKDLSVLGNFKVSEALERIAFDEERKQGLDIADFLLRKDFSNSEPQNPKANTQEASNNQEEADNNNDTYYITIGDISIPVRFVEESEEDWTETIHELELFFAQNKPEGSIRLDSVTVITDVDKFLKSHFSMIKNNNGNPHFKPYLDRLILLKENTNKICLFNK